MLVLDVPVEDELVRAHHRPPRLPRREPSLPRHRRAAEGAGRVRHRRLRAVPARRRPRGHRAPARRHLRARDRAGARALPRAGGTPGRGDRRARGPERSRPTCSRPSMRRLEAADDPPQVAARARAHGRGRLDRGADARAAARRARPGRDDGRARPRSPRSSSAARAGCRRSRATTASRPRSAPRRTTWSCTGSPGEYTLRDGRRHLGRRGRDAARLGRPTPADAVRRRGRSARGRRAPARRLPRSRCSPRSSSASTAAICPTSGTPVQTRVEADGFGVIRSLVGHGVGRRMHEDPQIPNYGPPGRGPVLQTRDDAGRGADDHRQRRDRRAARRGRRLVDLSAPTTRSRRTTSTRSPSTDDGPLDPDPPRGLVAGRRRGRCR